MTGRALLVANAAAGSAGADDVRAAARLLHDALDVTTVRGGRGELVAALRSFDGDRVVVTGGDGSLHEVVAALDVAGRLADLAVGLVPAGTGNDLARGVELPIDPVAAAHVCIDGSATPMDLLVADDGECVVNAAHAGLSGAVDDRARAVKDVAGPLAYPLGAIGAAVAEDGYDLTVAVDGRTVHAGPLLFVLAANSPSVGGGARLCPAADPADGHVDVLAIDAVALPARAGLGIDIQRGRHLDRDDVHVWRGRHVAVSGEAVDHVRDGERRHRLSRTTYTIRPGAWRLLRPTPDARTVAIGVSTSNRAPERNR